MYLIIAVCVSSLYRKE